MNGAAAAPKPAGFDIGFLAGQVLRRWPVIVAAVVLVVIAGQQAQALFQPHYTSGVSVLIDPRRPNALGADTEFGNLLVDSAKVASVGLIMTSYNVLGRVVDAQKLNENTYFNAPFVSVIDKLRTLVGMRTERPDEDTANQRWARALYRLDRAIRTTRVGITYVMTVEVTANTPDLARELAAAVVDSYLQEQQELKLAVAQRDAKWMTEQTRNLRTEMLRSEQEVETIRQSYGILETDRAPNSTTARQSVTELNAELSAAAGDLAAKRARYEQVQRLRASGSLETLPEVVSSHTISELRLSLTDALKKYRIAQRDSTPAFMALSHPDDDLKQLKSQIAAETARIAEAIANDYQTAQKRRDALAAQLEEAMRQDQKPGQAEGRIKLREAQQVVEANRALYESRLKQLREVEQQQTRLDPEARVISPAAMPDQPSFPKPMLFLAAGGALGLVSGTSFAGLRAFGQARRVRLDTVEASVSVPVLGKIPMLAGSNLPVRSEQLGPVRYLAANPMSLYADSFRSLRAGLRIGTERPPRILLVTSALPGEGKSTVAASLALSNAIAGHRTALVDVDMRKGTVWRALGAAKADLTESDSGFEPKRTAEPFDGVPLKVITPGRFPPDMIEWPPFRAFIRGLASRFDLVVLDSPPVLLAAEAISLAELADTRLLVTEAQGTQVQLLEEAAKLLRVAGAPLTGVIMNKLDPRRNRYYYGPKCFDALDETFVPPRDLRSLS